MPKQQSLTRTTGGLQTNPNALNEATEGALLEATNCVCDRPGVVSRRRGFERYQPIGTSAEAMGEYMDRLLFFERSLSTVWYDSDGQGNFQPYSGSFDQPDAQTRMRFLENQSTLYLTTSRGVFRTDSLTENPVRSGIPTALDLLLVPRGTGGSWFTPGTQVGYRIVWGRVDRLDRLQQGAPSFREVVVNTFRTALSWARSGTTITVTQPAHGYSGGDIVEIKDSSDQSPLPAGSYTISNISTDTYDVTGNATGSTSGTCSAGKKFDVELDFTVPDDIVDGDFYEIYRTELSSGVTVDPGDNQKRVIRNGINQSSVTLSGSGSTVTVTQVGHGLATGHTIILRDVSAGNFGSGRRVITRLDDNTYTYTVSGAASASGTANVIRGNVVVLDDWDLPLGQELYTNVRQDGILGANSRPPLARDVAVYKDYTFYSNTLKEHFVVLQLIDIDGLIDGVSSITLTEEPTALSYTFAASEDLSTRSFKRSTSEPTEAQNIERTAKSLCRVINRSQQSLWYAWYISGIEDSPGEIVIEARTLGTVETTVKANSSATSRRFSPNLPTFGTTLRSESQRGKNRLYRSKLGEPESVPELSWDPIGDDSNEILRIFALRDSLMIITEEGIYRLSGDSERTFAIKQLDPSVAARAPESWVVLSNSLYGLSTDGVVRVTEAGTQLVSWPIDDKVDFLRTITGYRTICHAVAYESEKLYLLWAPEFPGQGQAEVTWVYSTLTKRWGGPWRKRCRAAHVLFDEDRLYVESGSQILRERKSLTLNDYLDEDIPCQVTRVGETTSPEGFSVSEVEVSFSSGDLVEGWAFRQSPAALPYSQIDLVSPVQEGSTYLLRLRDFIPGLRTGGASVALPIPTRVRWAPESAKNPSALKQFSAVTIYFESGQMEHSLIGFRSDMDTTETFPREVIFSPQSPGLAHRELVPGRYSRCRALEVIHENRWARENLQIAHVGYSLRVTGDRTMVRTR